MLDEEILSKYKTEIDDDIEKIIAEYGLADDSAIAELTAKYKQNFIKGFHQGIEIGETRGIEKIAINMIKQNLDFKLISQVTGFSEQEIQKLKDRFN